MSASPMPSIGATSTAARAVRDNGDGTVTTNDDGADRSGERLTAATLDDVVERLDRLLTSTGTATTSEVALVNDELAERVRRLFASAAEVSGGHEVVAYTNPNNPSHVVGVEIDGRRMRAEEASVSFGVDELTWVTVRIFARSVRFVTAASTEADDSTSSDHLASRDGGAK